MTLSSRIPFLLYSYLATEMLAPFFASFLIMNTVFFLVKLIPFLNFVLQLDIGIADFIRLVSYLFPAIFLYTIPMSAMLGITIGFSRLSSDMEILAIKAGGVSVYRILPPVIIVTATIATIAFYFSVKLIPASEISMKQLTYQILKEKVDKSIKEHTFSDPLGDYILYIDDIGSKTGIWHKVWIADNSSPQSPTIIMAERGTMQMNQHSFAMTISLYNGSMHRTQQNNNEIINFKTYTVTIPLELPANGITMLHKKLLSMKQLLQFSEKYGMDTRMGRQYLVEYHKRLALPVGCLMLSFLALPLGLQARPGKKAIGIPVALLIFVFYYVIHTVGKEMAESGHVPIIQALWLPNFLFFGLAVFWIYQVTHEKPLIPEKLYYLLLAIYNKTFSPLLNFIQTTINRLNKLKK